MEDGFSWCARKFRRKEGMKIDTWLLIDVLASYKHMDSALQPTCLHEIPGAKRSNANVGTPKLYFWLVREGVLSGVPQI